MRGGAGFPLGWVAGGSVALLAAALLGVSAGAASLSAADIARHLLSLLPFGAQSPLTEREAAVLVELRLPRVVMGALVGALLATAGGAYQGVFRNPLADPYLLGAAAGAGLGATTVIVFGAQFSDSPRALVPVAAFAGALLGVAAAYLLGSTAGGGGTAALVLAGVAVSSFLSAAQTLVQQMGVDELQRIFAWLLGGLGRGGWDDVRLVAPYAVVGLAVLLASGYLLDMLALGDDKAVSLGLNPAAVRIVVIGAASLATAAAVSVSGLIGFVGIVVPHVVRRLVGSNYRAILPVTVLLGGAFLVLVDIVARTLIAPAELPIGVVTAFLGAPFFVLILRTTRHRGT
ncbi:MULTISPECIES: FecCD family ABC transporter permease [Nocardiopsis]|uniref:Transport system permease protein n=2 Tax=Nocardiopsis TaxID=2013 RepID=D7AUB1_NOCDD|nr:iron ABC transporter permease [Nocardiopsis dassonvillei]ADH65669.1 transport system permease protein [Nocardiopsis dassonvillei subsp. dassonvillei DSM 43111]APC34023.1 ABC transporter permease [Nocardiopsis dassonvillei]NKY79708.1 iron ABC transporter permease [Nocardiopsis dassonvillei]VEI91688.1 Probable siderophore transport system permease protein yfhA [Nocardiopsis dassonvillei]